jgi:hypothetical protein
MPYLLVKQKIVDFNRWYAVFKSDARAQKEAGLHDLVILKEIYDPNSIVCLFKIDDLDKAKAFTTSPNSVKSADLSGIIGIPEILFLEKA